MKRIYILLVFCLSALGSYAQTIRVTPQWTPQAQFVGLYVADAMGFYAEEGLDVVIKHPSATRTSYQMLKDGDTDVIISQMIDAIIQWDKGFKMYNILQTSETNSLMIVSQMPVKSLADLRGKRIGHWKAGFSHQGFILDKMHNMNIEWIPFHSNIAIYISGAIDATLAMEYNEYFQLVMSGTQLDDSQLLYLRDYGFNIQEDGLYVTPKFLARNKDRLGKFVRATQKAWEWTRDNQEEALNIVMDVVEKADVPTNRVNQE